MIELLTDIPLAYGTPHISGLLTGLFGDIGFKLLVPTIKAVSPLAFLYGGGKVGFKATSGQPFQKDLLTAIVGLCFFVVAETASASLGSAARGIKDNAVDAANSFLPASTIGMAGSVFGGLILLIGLTRVGWKASNSEPFQKDLIMAIIGSSIVAACLIGVR